MTKKKLLSLIVDALAVIGGVAITAGVWLFDHRIGLIVGGAFLIASAVVIAYAKGGDKT